METNIRPTTAPVKDFSCSCPGHRGSAGTPSGSLTTTRERYMSMTPSPLTGRPGQGCLSPPKRVCRLRSENIRAVADSATRSRGNSALSRARRPGSSRSSRRCRVPRCRRQRTRRKPRWQAEAHHRSWRSLAWWVSLPPCATACIHSILRRLVAPLTRLPARRLARN